MKPPTDRGLIESNPSNGDLAGKEGASLSRVASRSERTNSPLGNGRIITFSNGISLHLDVEGDRFFGIGEVLHNGESLRSGKLPWNLYTESEAKGRGLRFEDFTLDEIEEDVDEVTLKLSSEGSWMPRVQEADSMGEARICPRRLERVVAKFNWRIRAITETIQENRWHGLAMQVSFDCDAAPIHWLLESTTWEIGADASGCTLIQQDLSTMELEQKTKKESEFSTVEKFYTEGWGGNYPMDMMPRAAGAAICDFQYKDETALCVFVENLGHVRARIEKFADEDVIHYLDRSYFPLAAKAEAPERKLLVFSSDQKLERHDARNLWLDCFTEVRSRIHKLYGFELEIPQPSTGGHLWDEDLDRYMEKWPELYEQDFEEYSRMGYKQLYFHGVWEGLTTRPNPPEEGNICCPYAFRYASMFGGPERMKEVAEKAKSNGLQLMQWYCFHLSRHAPVWKEHPDWLLKEANGDPWDGAYRKLWSGRMRSGYGEEFKKQVLAVKEETGVDGIFWDSYHNLGVVAIDWGAPDKSPQATEIFQMQAELQRNGFKQWNEAVTIFGVSRVAMFGFEDNSFRRRLWSDCVDGDQAFVLLDTSPSFFMRGSKAPLVHPDRLSADRYFWLAGHRVLPVLSSDPWKTDGNKERFAGGEHAKDYARVNHLYNGAIHRMKRLRLQRNGTHTVWLDEAGEPAVIWVFGEGVPVPGGDWLDAESGESPDSTLTPQRVYVAG